MSKRREYVMSSHEMELLRDIERRMYYIAITPDQLRLARDLTDLMARLPALDTAEV